MRIKMKQNFFGHSNVKHPSVDIMFTENYLFRQLDAHAVRN